MVSRDAPSIVEALPINIYVAKRKSDWMDLSMMLQVIRLLGAILEPLTDTVPPILIMYACIVDVAEAVVRACRRANIVSIIVLARMTWLLHHCDSHAFRRVKTVLRSLALAARVKTISGRLDTYSLFNASTKQSDVYSKAFDGHVLSMVRDRPSYKNTRPSMYVVCYILHVTSMIHVRHLHRTN